MKQELDLYIKNLEQERCENIKKDKYYRLALVLEKIQNDIKDVMSKTFYESGATSLRKEHIINDHTKEVIDSINDKLKLNNPINPQFIAPIIIKTKAILSIIFIFNILHL